MPFLIIKNKLDGKALKATFDSPKVTLGSGPENTIVLEGPGVSRDHCVLYRKNGRYLLRDLGSKNGTFVDAEALTGPVVLEEGSKIIVGPYKMTFRTVERSAAESAASPARRRAEAAESPEAPDEPAAPPAPKKAAPAEPPPPPTPPAVPVEEAALEGDEATAFARFKKQIHETLIADKRMKQVSFAESSDQEVRQKTVVVIKSLLDELPGGIPDLVDRARLEKELLEDVLGLGPLEDLIADETVSEIMVDAFDKIFIERRGKIVQSTKRFIDNEHVVEIIRRIIAPIGRRINESTPLVDARLKDGSRVNAVIPPIAISGPSLTIRKFMKRRLTAEDLIRLGSMSPQIAGFLELCVKAKFNMIISGGTGTGKTTLLNMIANWIPPDERIVTVEDVAELRLPHENIVNMETRPPNLEGTGEIPIRKLVINSLRMRPDRIIVGECRGGAIDMLQAMNTGHEGSLTTVHANSPKDACARLENLVLMAGMDLPARAIREQIASALNLIVQISRFSDGTRRVVRITEISGMEGDVICLNDIFAFEHLGFDADGKIKGTTKPTRNVPKLFDKLRERGIEVDMSILDDEDGSGRKQGRRAS